MTTTEMSALLSRSALSRRGWTKSMIIALLGEPDVQRPNPVIASGAPMGFYRRDRVSSCEATPEFERRRERAKARADSYRKRARHGDETLAARLLATHVEVPPLTLPKLVAVSVEHHNRQARDRCRPRTPGGNVPVRMERAKAADLARWEVDYLCHVMTRYETLLSQLVGRLGKTEARRLVNARVYSAIAARYPWLAGECQRRMSAPPTQRE